MAFLRNSNKTSDDALPSIHQQSESVYSFTENMMDDESKGRTSFIKSCYNATGAFLGIGILTLPYSLAKGGWLSLPLLLLIAYMSFYGGILLKKCMQTNTCITSYEDIAEQAFGWKGRIMVWIMVNLELYLIAIGLLIMEGDNLHKLFPNFALKFGQISIGGRLLFVIITMFVILPSLLSTDLGTVSYITAVGLFSIIIIIASLLFVGSASGVGFHGKRKLLSMGGIPTSIALYVSCFGGHPVIPTVYMSMQDRGQFTKAMLVSFFFNTIVYLSMAIVGYLMYGNNVDSLITLNLPTEEISSKVALYTTLVIPVTRYALVVSPVANALESGPLQCYRDTRRIRFLIRISILVSTTMVACAFPYFEFLMAVVGSTLVVFASFLLPCFCYLKISRGYQISRSELTSIIGIIVFGIFAGIIGTYASIAELVQKM